MARQIIENTLNVHLPENTDEVSGYLKDNEKLSILFTITPQQSITITEVSVEENFENTPVDITGKIGTHDFVIYFTHPSRDVPIELYAPKNTKSGIVAVSLDETYPLFASSKASSQSYKEILLSFLKNDLSSKHWVFHPRHEAKKDTAKKELSEAIKAQNEKLSRALRNHQNICTDLNSESSSLVDHIEDYYTPSQEYSEYKEPERKLAKYECVICRTQWEGIEPGINLCPKCKTHLFSKFLAYV